VTNGEKYEYWIAEIRNALSDLRYEKKNLQKRMHENSQRTAEYKKTLKRLEEERRKEHERAQGDADVQSRSAVG